MATISNIEHVGAGAWKITTSSVNTPYRYYVAGRLVAGPITEATYIVQSNDYLTEPPVVDVLDSTESEPTTGQARPPYVILQWRGDTDAAYYTVQKYIGSTWTAQRPVIQETGLGYYRWESQKLADVANHQFRILATDAEGYTSTARQVEVFMIRYPDPPSFTATYTDLTNTLAISSA